MHRSRNLGHDKKGPNFNHAHGRSHTALWHRTARSRSIVLSVGISVQAMPTAVELRTLRREHVKTLRTAAKTAGVLVVPDGAARAKVQTMAEAIAASSASADVRQGAADALAAYVATYADDGPLEEAPAPGGAASSGDGFRLRGRSFLLTYNWDFFRRELPRRLPCS